MTFQDYGYDIEVYKNQFLCTIMHAVSGHRWIFEISIRHNHTQQLYQFLVQHMGAPTIRMVGYNNEAYDYLIIHYFMQLVESGHNVTPMDLYAKSQQVIGASKDDKFGMMVWPDQRKAIQVDLLKIHHFDNVAKFTSLKKLEFAMRSQSIQDLPYPFDTELTPDQMAHVLTYNCHDVDETLKFYDISKPLIDFRDELTAELGMDVTNFNDTKIGKKYFEMELEKKVPGICYENRKPRQTHRSQIRLADVIFPYVSFHTPELQRVLTYLQNTTLTQTKSPPELKNLTATLGDFEIVFGAGGIHSSIPAQTVRSDNQYEIVDIDATSFYPSLAIVNRVFPKHLSDIFCDIYGDMKTRRLLFEKGTPQNQMLKLALNGVYGDSNNKYGPFYDPQYTMAITINGQLLLCMLAEQFYFQGWDVLQMNTDGLTIRIPRGGRDRMREFCEVWEKFTCLDLEYQYYAAMHIRDVNNYIAVKTNMEIKRNGAYQYEFRSDQWNKDRSSLIIQKAVEAELVHGTPVEQYINECVDPFDFCILTKVNRTDKLAGETVEQRPVYKPDGTPLMKRGKNKHLQVHEDVITHSVELQKTCRHHISYDGVNLMKTMPPLAKAPGKYRRIGQFVGWTVNVCNNMDDFDWSMLNREYYIEKARELVDVMG